MTLNEPMNLMETQRRVLAALTLPLTPAGRIARKTRAGVPMSIEAATFIKPNDRLSSLERLEIYIAGAIGSAFSAHSLKTFPDFARFWVKRRSIAWRLPI